MEYWSDGVMEKAFPSSVRKSLYFDDIWLIR
jgi:hypothetical protein